MTTNTFTLLTIDKNEVTQNIFADHLHGLRDIPTILHAQNGQDAMQLIREQKPDLLLLDIQLPQKDGLEVLSNVVKETPSTRIIVISDGKREKDKMKALQLGAWRYLTKPITPKLLSQTITSAQKRQKPLPFPQEDVTMPGTKENEKTISQLKKILTRTRKETRRERDSQ